jgi:hypothetical protein
VIILKPIFSLNILFIISKIEKSKEKNKFRKENNEGDDTIIIDKKDNKNIENYDNYDIN